MVKDLKNNFIIVAIILIATIIFKNISLNFFNDILLFKIFSKVILILAILWSLRTMGMLRKLYPSKATIPFALASLIVIFFLLNMTLSEFEQMSVTIELKNHLIFIFDCLTTGVFEELLFRILLFYLFLKVFKHTKNKLILSILTTSLIFGILHLINLFDQDYDRNLIINQVLFATAIGIFLQSLYLKTKSIILIIVLHSMINYFGTYKTTLMTENKVINKAYNSSFSLHCNKYNV